MKRFLIYFNSFIVVCVISIFGVWSLADGTTDAFYVKFTTTKQSSLIIGSSRAAQNLQPEIISHILPETIFYNYAFSRVHTPYGAAYFNSIKKKIIARTQHGVYIIEVNPWSISGKIKRPEYSGNDSFLNIVSQVDRDPNFEYLLKAFDQRNIKIILNRFKSNRTPNFFVQDDGWLEVKLDESIPARHKLSQQTMKSYKKIVKEYSGLSQNRMMYLQRIIDFLKAHGEVYLIRLPVNDEMLEIENQLLPDFDIRMLSLSRRYNIDYINFMPQRAEFKYTDGHHLVKASSDILSQKIGELIKQKTK